ncbi:MAG: aspartyl-phosphate phosphatase Spo0E family protein [Bacillota bacterium]
MEKTKLTILESEIEEIRLKINKIASDKNHLDNEVIKLSKKLDERLNKYHQIKNKSCS